MASDQNQSDKKWKQEAILFGGEKDRRNPLNQLVGPRGICIDDNQNVYIVDQGNGQIIELKSNSQYGRIVAGGNFPGKRIKQLSYPTAMIIDEEKYSFIIADPGNRRVMRWSRENYTKGEILIKDIDCWGLAMDKDGSLYVSDFQKDEVRRWKRGEQEGTIVAGGQGRGDRLNQLNRPMFIFVDEHFSLYISDCYNHRIIKWKKDAKEGIIVAGGNGDGNSLKQFSYTQAMIIDQSNEIYVADCCNHRIMCWHEGDVEGRVVAGGNGPGKQLNQLYYPSGLSWDAQRNLYVVEHGNHRIAKFEIET